MARWAVEHEDGLLDLERMAARLGLGEGAALAALRALEAGGALQLQAGAEGWRVEAGDGAAAPAAQRRRRLEALERHLQEAAAFRAAYPSLGLEALLADR